MDTVEKMRGQFLLTDFASEARMIESRIKRIGLVKAEEYTRNDVKDDPFAEFVFYKDAKLTAFGL